MTESEFLALVEATLDRIEATLDENDVPVDWSRSGNVLTLEFDGGGRMVINSQSAMQELWVAARAGGFHFRHDGTFWRDTKDGSELYAHLAALMSREAGQIVRFAPPQD